MKRLSMCEGPNELAIMRVLIAQDKLIFGEDELIGLTPFHLIRKMNYILRICLRKNKKVLKL